MAEVTVSLEKLEDIPVLFGKYDENIKLIENEFGVSVVQRDNQLKLSGAEGNALLASKVLEEMNDYVATGTELSEQTVRYLIGMAKEGATVSAAELVGDCVCITAKGKPIRGKTLGQKEYIAAMEKNTVVMAIGPAGTGKTYLAVAGGGAGLPCQADFPHHPDTARCGGGGEAGLPAGGHADESGPVPPAAV